MFNALINAKSPSPSRSTKNGRWERKESFFAEWNCTTQIQNNIIPNFAENPLNYNVSTFARPVNKRPRTQKMHMLYALVVFVHLISYHINLIHGGTKLALWVTSLTGEHPKSNYSNSHLTTGQIWGLNDHAKATYLVFFKLSWNATSSVKIYSVKNLFAYPKFIKCIQVNLNMCQLTISICALYSLKYFDPFYYINLQEDQGSQLSEPPQCCEVMNSCIILMFSGIWLARQ